MGKFRSKITRHTKGKRWAPGHSATSNPENMKHRLKAKSRFFQPDIKAVSTNSSDSKPSLTLEALAKHDARQMYASGKTEPTINEIAGSLKSFSFDDESMSESQGGSSFKTFKTFASDFSQCSNMSFKKLLNGFRTTSNLHREMLAILTALTEVIKERKGKESSTEYFLLLMQTIDASKEEKELLACISLLAMGIKTVPIPVLRVKFSETAGKLIELMQQYVESENLTVVRQLIGCMSVLLRAQEHQSWSYSSTMRYLDGLLSFTLHSKPKIRKAAQHAVIAIIQGSCFMLPRKPEGKEENDEQIEMLPPLATYHPASGRVAKFCLNQFKPENLSKSQKLILHTITLLSDTLSGMNSEDIRQVCEGLLSIMTATNVLIRTTCFKSFYTFFQSKTRNISNQLLGKLIAAIYEYRPDREDIRQTLAWLAVLKEAHIHLSKLDLQLCTAFLPKFIEICSGDLWMSDKPEIVTGASNTLKEILYECVRPVCTDAKLCEEGRESVTKVINIIAKALAAPFGEVAKYVVLTFAIVFEVTGPKFSDALHVPIMTLGNRYDTNSSLRLAIEHAIITAIQFVGVENVLKAIPLASPKGEVLIDKTWLLPLLREGINGSTFEFFANYILKLAFDCNLKWQKFKEENSVSNACTYELLCCQLWGLFPGFCRDPKDYPNFKLIAKTIGVALVDNPEFRAPILDGLNELITNANEEQIGEIAKYAKNFVPRLLNIYRQKPEGTYETELRAKILETIKIFLGITPAETLVELYETAVEQLKTLPPGHFTSDAFMDVANLLVIYQNVQNIKKYFERFVAPIIKDTNNKIVAKDDQKLKKQQRRAYELLKQLVSTEREECKKFMKKNATAIEELLLEALPTGCPASQATRLMCLKLLIESKPHISVKDNLIIKSIPEAILIYKEFSTKKQDIAEQLLKQIGEVFEKKDKLNDFVDMVMAGFGGDQVLIANTIFALRSVVQHFTGCLTVKTIEFILEQVLVFLKEKNRQEAEAAVVFLIAFIKVLPSPLVANNLQAIVKSLSAMSPDTKRFCRLQLGYLLKKMSKRFTAEEIIKLVPGNDELTHRRLKKIRKQLRRESRKKETQKESDDESEEEFVDGLETKSMTIEDILADSDSDLPDDEDENTIEMPHRNKKKSKDKQTFIQEDEDEIIDLADIKSIKNILTVKPGEKIKLGSGTTTTKAKDPNRGFKTAEDGRLIIDDKMGSDSDDDDDGDDDGVAAKSKSRTAAKRGLEEDSSDEDEEMPMASNRKRQALDAVSMKSGKAAKSASSSKYVAGGKGIHRPAAATSVKSGYSAKSRVSSASTKTAGTFGTDYKSNKSKGDMKRKGKLDPYAYIPLSRNILNKRKRAKNAGQFKNIVAGARKGASKGLKGRVKKAYKK